MTTAIACSTSTTSEQPKSRRALDSGDLDPSPFSWPVVVACPDNGLPSCWAADDLSASPIPEGILSPLWQMLLLGDGSPTRQLALLTGSPTHVQLLDAVAIGDDVSAAPAAVCRVAAPRVRRRVVLRNGRSEPLMHAVSWWSDDAYRRLLADPTLPIGTSITGSRLELFRQMVDVRTGRAPAELFDGEVAAAEEGSVWARSYLMFVGGHAVALIHEVFSPALQRVLGPYAAPAARVTAAVEGRAPNVAP